MDSSTIMRMCNTARTMSAHKKKRMTTTEGRRCISIRLLRINIEELNPTPHMARLATLSRQGRISTQLILLASVTSTLNHSTISVKVASMVQVLLLTPTIQQPRLPIWMALPTFIRKLSSRAQGRQALSIELSTPGSLIEETLTYI